MKKILAAGILFCAGLTGCNVPVDGQSFDESNISRIQRGVTTQADLIRLFGQPSSIREQDGITNLSWKYTSVPLVGTGKQSHILSVALDAAGKVKAYEMNHEELIPSVNVNHS